MSDGSIHILLYSLLVFSSIIHSFIYANSRWQFASDGSDIGFGIYMKTKAGVKQKITEMQEVLPTTRYNAHLVPEDGSYTCEEPGICKYKLSMLMLFAGTCKADGLHNLRLILIGF